MAEAHLGLRGRVEEVGAHNQGVVGEVGVLHLEEVVGVECLRGQEEVEEGEEEEDRHQVEVAEEVVGEVVVQHPLVRVEEVVLQAQLDPPQSGTPGPGSSPPTL